MNIPFESPCMKCGTTNEWKLWLSQNEVKWPCRNCGYLNVETLQDDITIGWKILWRAYRELSDGQDTSMSIVLAAMALDCEISRLFRKSLADAGEPLAADKVEEKLRQLGTAPKKLDKVSSMMDPEGIDGFVRKCPDMAEFVRQEFPQLSGRSLQKAFEELVFWPRNSILHAGDVSFDEKRAWEVYELAKLGIVTLQRMEMAKYGSIN